jgi:predicted nuclease of predicted toxin-antitoxin system
MDTFNSREKYRRRAENGTGWTGATAPHNTTVVSTHADFNTVKMRFGLPFVIASVRVSTIATAEQAGA